MLRPQSTPPIPEATARAARAVFRKGHRYLTLRDELGTIFDDQMFTDLFPKVGQPAEAPWRLALVTLVQFAEGLSDREAADAVRERLSLKYLLSLELEDPGFDFSILSRFRDRLVAGRAEARLLDTLVDRCRNLELIRTRGKARTDATQVLANVKLLNRLELVGETLRATLNVLAVAAPEWLQEVAEPEWYGRYSLRIENRYLPEEDRDRDAAVQQIGLDGYKLLLSVYEEGPEWLAEVSAVETLRRVWVQQYWLEQGEVHFRRKGNLAPSVDRLESPYDPDAKYGIKGEVTWVGYKVHLTEMCDRDLPRLVTNVETTTTKISDIATTDLVHASLEKRDLLPDEHLVDGGYIRSTTVLKSLQQHNVTLIGPVKPNPHWQAKGEGYDITRFCINWNNKVVTCPEGKKSISWRQVKGPTGEDRLRIKWSRTDCRLCPTEYLCKRSRGEPKILGLALREQHELIQKVRTKQKSKSWKKLYNLRAGVEATISQGVRAFGMRRCRYRGIDKTHLQMTATAAAINLQRLDDWLAGSGPAGTRVSAFARLNMAA